MSHAKYRFDQTVKEIYFIFDELVILCVHSIRFIDSITIVLSDLL